MVDTTNVGVVNHAHFGSLTLHSGHKYYATVTGNCTIKVKKKRIKRVHHLNLKVDFPKLTT